MTNDKKQKTSPPYVAWRTFINFISSLRETGLPSQINRSVMSNLSYSTQAQLLAALRSLGMTDAIGTPTQTLAQLVEGSEENQAIVIKQMLNDRYGFVLKTLDLARATPDELEKQFREIGITGSTVDRAVAFFLGAAEAASLQLSPHLKKKNGAAGGSVPRARPARKRNRTPPGQRQSSPPQELAPNNSNGTNTSYEKDLLNKFPDFDPAWSEELKQNWFDGFKTLLGMAPAKKAEP